MSWVNSNDCEVSTFLQGLEEASLPISSWDTSPSAPLRLSHTVNPCLCSDNAMVCCPGSPSGMMSAPLMDTPGVDGWTSLQVASRAKTSVLPENAPDFRVVAQAYGQSSPVLLGKYDPATSSLKTLQLSLLTGSPESLQTLPRWGWMRGGAVWALMMSVPRTTDNDSGFWPTPTMDMITQRKKRYAQGGMPLTAAVTMFPTPTINGNYNRNGASATSGDGLETVVRQFFPTPTANMTDMTSMEQQRLSGRQRQKMRDHGEPLPNNPGMLNPHWVCWLMNWPLGWTAPGGMNPQTFRAWLVTSRNELRNLERLVMARSR